jgi:TolA-binding protein
MKEMMRSCQSLISILLLFPAALPAAAEPALPAPWAVPEARLRLRLERDREGAWPAAAALCPLSAGSIPPENAALRVTDAAGRPVPSSVLWARQGQPLALLFETASQATSYYAYVSAGSNAPADWRPQAGILLETRTQDRPAFDSRAQFDSAWTGATGVWGRGIRIEIFEGIHPFGPPEHFLGRFDAWFRTAQAGEYGFATLSDDASFVSVDGKPVAEWPGIHGTDGGRLGEKKGSITLAPGLHHLRYEVAQGESLYAAVASWKKPGKRYFEVMQPADFEPLARFSCQAAEQVPGTPAPAHFEWRIARSARLDDALMVMPAFRALVPPDAACRWEFGDGTSAEGPAPEHAYIGAGPRTVVLEVRRTNQPPARQEQVVDVQALWRQAEECPDSALSPIRESLQARAIQSLSQTELETACLFVRRLGDPVWLDQLAGECLRRQPRFPDAFRSVLHAMGQNARQALFRKYEEADRLFTLALTLTNAADGAAAEARLRLDQAENRLNGQGQPDSAGRLIAAIPDDPLDAAARRRKILLAVDADLALGRRDEALRLARTVPPVETGVMGDVHRQARLLTAADYVRREEWSAAADHLAAILTDFPMERFNGETVLLLMDAQAGRGETGPALKNGERLLQVDLLDDTRARLLLKLVRLYKAAGQADAAARCREQLKRDYPYSEAAALAASLP